MPTVLIIAGSDSSGGAGIARDLTTLVDHHINACCAITAVTVQTNDKVMTVHHVPPDVIQQQISAALATHQVDAIKIGMLGRVETVGTVIAALSTHRNIPLIVDPVLRSSSGSPLLDEAGVSLLLEQLLPRTLILTPNIFEAAVLLGEPQAPNEMQLISQGQKLLKRGPRALLIKGGHAQSDMANDLLLTDDGKVTVLTANRIKGDMRGTGCALASAIAAHLAQGSTLEDACRSAKSYVRNQIEAVSVN